jgi:hypothetical protein
MSVDPGRWRDLQISNFKGLKDTEVVLEQEKFMLDFCTSLPDVKWCWQAPISDFYRLCNQKLQLVLENYNGIILFGLPICDSKTLVEHVSAAIKNIEFAYVGINRYSVRNQDLDPRLPDSIEDSLDLMIKYCDPRFKRLHTFQEVDGNHMVFSHPMDCYILCK